MKTEIDLEQQGTQDARMLIVGTDEAAKKRLIDHAGDFDDAGCLSEDARIYITGFRLIADAHLRHIERDLVGSDDREGHLTAFADGDIDVFREGGDYIYYVDDREFLAYRAPTT